MVIYLLHVITGSGTRIVLQHFLGVSNFYVHLFLGCMAGIFGSIVRGESTSLSDIDVLVDFEDGADLFDLVALNDYLQQELDQKVDIVSKRALRIEIKDHVYKEMIAVWKKIIRFIVKIFWVPLKV